MSEPKTIYPRTDVGRAELLNQILTESLKDLRDGSRTIPHSFRDEIETFTTPYTLLVRRIQRRAGARGLEVDQRNHAITKLEKYVRDFWEVLSRRIEREEEDEGLHLIYGLPRSGENPPYASAQAWLRYGTKLVDGDSIARARGFPPMVNPSAANVQYWVEQVTTELNDVRDADRLLDDAQHEADAQRSQADMYIRQVASFIEIAMHGMSRDDIRHVKHRYGYQYDESPSGSATSSEDEASSDSDDSRLSDEG